MGAFFKGTLPLVLIAGALSGLAGYAYGVHSSQPAAAAVEHAAADLARAGGIAAVGVLEAPPSWRRWPQLTDF